MLRPDSTAACPLANLGPTTNCNVNDGAWRETPAAAEFSAPAFHHTVVSNEREHGVVATAIAAAGAGPRAGGATAWSDYGRTGSARKRGRDIERPTEKPGDGARVGEIAKAAANRSRPAKRSLVLPPEQQPNDEPRRGAAKNDIRARRWCKASAARAAAENDVNRVMIQNMVYTVNLGTSLSLSYIARECFEFVEYNPQRFAAVIMRFRSPVATVLLFSTGKGVCTGCKSSGDMAVAMRAVRSVLISIGLNVPFIRNNLRNVVANATLGLTVNLDRLAVSLAEEACYDPELFPGLVYRPHSREVSLLVFQSGAIVLTGCADENSVRIATAHVERIRAIVNHDLAMDAEAMAASDARAIMTFHRFSKRVPLEKFSHGRMQVKEGDE